MLNPGGRQKTLERVRMDVEARAGAGKCYVVRCRCSSQHGTKLEHPPSALGWEAGRTDIKPKVARGTDEANCRS